jgi:peptide/nickel transport system substrate-binding protein
VYQYLIKQAEDTSTYATSKLWADVDGPWKLTSFAVDGPVKFDLNPSYGGPLPPHHISHFEEVPFTTEQAEYNVMQAGGSQTLDVGYLPTVDAPVPPAGESVGENPLDGYNLKPLYSWGLNYVPFNFDNTQVGPVFHQLYFRQAMQYLMDQEGVVSGPLHGYGVVSVGQVGDVPTTPYLSAQIRTGDKYALNPTAASALLRQNGWTVNPGKQTTCTSPGTGAGQCGKGIRPGEGLTFNLDYDSGTSWVASEVRELVSNAAEVGITINATPASFNQVITETGANKWQILDWGNGWSYSPDYLPTGEELFATGSAANFGHYSDPTNDALIQASLRAPNATTFYRALHKWEDYLENQIPVLMQPEGVFELTETRDGLVAPPQTPTLMLTPEDWYFVK